MPDYGALGVGTLVGVTATAVSRYLVAKLQTRSGDKKIEQDSALAFGAQLYSQQSQEIGRLQARAEALEKRADDCEGREQQLLSSIASMLGKVERLEHQALRAIIEADEHQTVTSWNTAAERLFGWTAAEMIGKKLVNCLVPADDLEQHEAAFQLALTKEHFPEVIIRKSEGVSREGVRVPVKIQITRRKDLSGRWLFTAEITPR